MDVVNYWIFKGLTISEKQFNKATKFGAWSHAQNVLGLSFLEDISSFLKEEKTPMNQIIFK